MFYQSANSLHADLWKMESGTDFHFPPHLHSSFEWITVTEGELMVTVDKKQYSICPGKALLIFPNQVHSFDTPVHSCHVLCIFSPKLVQAYNKKIYNKIPTSNLFTPSPFFVDRLLEGSSATLSEFQIKGLLYSLCGEFDNGASYVDRTNDRDDLLAKIFHFVEENYNRDCSLEVLSAQLAYHYVYLSRYFKQCIGLSYTDYVNHYRINEAGYILQNTQQTILQTAYDCGFDSLRSFNRNFKKVMGMTPGAYRQNHTGVPVTEKT